MPATAPPAQAHAHRLAGVQAGAKPKLCNPRHPERTVLYQTIAEHFKAWFELASAGQFDGQGDHQTPKPYVRQAFRKYLECGIFAHGFARSRVVTILSTTTLWPIPVYSRRRMRGCTLSPIGTWHPKRHPTLRLISASVGEGLRRRF